jgi:transcriptional regulator with PAS, ATPase and Fis domain
MVVKSNAVVLQMVRKTVKVASVATSVLIYGESGLDKSMLARIIQ